MFSFFYGDREQIRQNEFDYLLSIKRMLPRYLNSLPDQSFRFMHRILNRQVTLDKPIMVETGIGASTILLLNHAMRTGGHLYSWDMNTSKAAALHQVLSETICGYHGEAVSKFWTFVPSDSTSEHTGIGLLAELTDRVDFSSHDSNHTWRVIEHEITGVLALMRPGSVICVDDANQTAVHTYEPIINVTRKKLGLESIKPISDNQGPPHYQALPKLYNRHYKIQEILDDTVESFDDDLYYAWYRNDRNVMNSVGMERFEDHAARFVAHQMIEKIVNP